MYIFWYKTTVFIQNLYILVKFFVKNFIFNAKSKFFFLFFQDQMYIFGYKTTVFIQNLYLLVKCFGKNIFRVKSTFLVHFWVKQYKICTFLKYFGKNFIFFTIFFLGGPNVHFWVQNYTFYPKFVHFSEIFWQKRHF